MQYDRRDDDHEFFVEVGQAGEIRGAKPQHEDAERQHYTIDKQSDQLETKQVSPVSVGNILMWKTGSAQAFRALPLEPVEGAPAFGRELASWVILSPVTSTIPGSANRQAVGPRPDASMAMRRASPEPKRAAHHERRPVTIALNRLLESKAASSVPVRPPTSRRPWRASSATGSGKTFARNNQLHWARRPAAGGRSRGLQRVRSGG
jgi:hypothetical protein